jgi:Zn-finger nucleic acid-binding protein/DNA-directed RNA polymerase subunit RPC12/RpoP
VRHLVACPRCGLQYDASGHPAGTRFRCSCGAEVVVPRLAAHDAAVVRCSSCGAPRRDGQTSCAFCGSDFTLREQDLDTICPHCAARISHTARFCHYCGCPIQSSERLGEVTERRCPVCADDGPGMVSRALGGDGLTVYECGRCGGLWLGNEAFDLLERQARDGGLSWLKQAVSSGHSAPRHLQAGEQAGPWYRPCVICGKPMNRLNYGRKSGVIIDYCAKHGLWFDRGELHRIVAWIQNGGLARRDRAEKVEQRAAASAERLRRSLDQEPEPTATWMGPSEPRHGSVMDFIDGLLEFLGRK